jgi:cytochrome c oxidase subunit IV
MLITENITGILVITGIITAFPLLQFFFPIQMIKHLNKLEIHDEAGLFYARHWGLLAFSIGILLVYAAAHPEIRTPIILSAMIEKAGMIAMGIFHRKHPYMQGMRVAVIFDTICVLLYAAYLGSLA